MALPAQDTFKPDIDFLHLLPADRERARVMLALGGVTVEALYRGTRPGVWQLETYNAPHIVRRALALNGVDVLAIEPDDAVPGTLYYVRFCPDPYGVDTDWPPAPYQRRVSIVAWDAAPTQPRTDVVAGPGGVVACDLEATPAALIPVPGVPGLDYSYADMGMIDETPALEQDERVPLISGGRPICLRYGQRLLPVAATVRTATGRVYARVNIGTGERQLWHYVPIASFPTRGAA